MPSCPTVARDGSASGYEGCAAASKGWWMMGITGSVKRLLVPALILALPQYGCVSRQLAPTIVSYNLAVESAQNDVLLLNAIRAEKHLPMYLTDISAINGSIRRDLTASLTLPFGHLLHQESAMVPDAAAVTGNGTAMPGATYSINPTFTFNVLNTQDFMRGFLKPVDIQTLAFYWDQAYPPELLLHLFILRVDVFDEQGRPVTSYHNHPQVPPYKNINHPEDINHDLRCFSEWITWFSKGAHFETVTGKAPTIGPPLDAKDLHMEDLLGVAADSDLTLTSKDHGFQLTSKPQASLQLVSSQSGSFVREADCKDTRAESLSLDAQGPILKGSTRASKSIILFHLRSPEGILYYLGQLSRLLHRTGQAARLLLEGYDELTPIFVALERHPTAPSPQLRCGSLVETTDAQRDSYFVPSSTASDKEGHDYLAPLRTCDPGLSMTSLNIVAQLIGLQKAAKDFPSTGVVRAIVQ
jgi:hypothetical protein